MRTETTDLVALFKKSNGGRHTWRYKEVDTSLPAADIKEACELLTTLDLFEQDGVKLFDSALSAKFVTTIETWIFDVEHDSEETQPEAEQAKEPTCEDVRCFEVIDEAEKTTTDRPIQLPSIEPNSIQPRSRHYDRLTRIETVENTESTIRVSNDSLPPLRNEPLVEIIGCDTQKQEAETIRSLETEAPSTEKSKGLFHRIFRRRSRNKEAPPTTPRE